MQQPQRNSQAIFLLFKWISSERKAISKIYFLAGLQGLLYISIPLGIQSIITYTMAGRFTASLVLLCIITVAITFFIGLLQLWQMRINETLQQKAFGQFVSKLNNVFKDVNTDHFKTKIAYFFEIITLQKGIGKIVLDLSFAIISIIFGLIILPIYSSWFLIFSVLLSISFYFVVVYYGKKALRENFAVSNYKYAVYKWFSSLEEINQSVTNIDIKADNFLNQYINQRSEYYHTIEKQYKGIFVFKLMFVAILLFFGTYLVQIGELTIGQFIASEIIVFLVINAIEKMIVSLETAYDIATALSKIESIFEYNPRHSFLNNDNQNYLPSYSKVYNYVYTSRIKKMVFSLFLTIGIILFMPWTQNIDMKGTVSAIDPASKPQSITSRIAGRIEKWYIQDGNLVKKNDTIAFISEIKEEYADTLLITRAQSQVKSKEVAMESYEGKINAIDQQIDALNKTLLLKVEQTRNKLKQTKAKLLADSAEYTAIVNNLKVAEDQFKRFEDIYSKGIISKTDLENRKVKLQEVFAKKITAENKIVSTKNELLNVEIELNSIQQEFSEKLMKSESDKFSTLSMFYDAEGSLTKLQNQLSNYAMRKSYYYVLAPQDGFVNNLTINGVGEIIKEGGVLCSIVPLQTEQAVELFIDPIDLPLIRKGQSIQLIFDGWPSFAFSGWPGVSYGTFNAKVVSFDKVISSNGKFRVLALNEKKDWPLAIQIGGGVQGFAMLTNVPVVYELWRKVNGFPPEFYKENSLSVTNKKGSEKNEK